MMIAYNLTDKNSVAFNLLQLKLKSLKAFHLLKNN